MQLREMGLEAEKGSALPQPVLGIMLIQGFSPSLMMLKMTAKGRSEQNVNQVQDCSLFLEVFILKWGESSETWETVVQSLIS